MSEQEIKTNLCYYDPENPSNNLDAYNDEDCQAPRNKCACDNCFYGRDNLAVQLLEAREALRRIVDLGKTMPEEAEEVRIARETLEAAK